MILTKIPYTTAQELLGLYEAKANVHLLTNKHTTPYELIDMAIKHEFFSDAVTFLAHALPVRESVWWATMCASTCNGWSTAEQSAISAARAWVYTSDEKSRRFAEQMAKEAKLGSGAGWVAQAAFWSSGSLTAPEDPSVSPPLFCMDTLWLAA